MLRLVKPLCLVLAVLGALPAEAGRDLDRVRERGVLRCGVQAPGNPGFGVAGSDGSWTGFNIDICRAIAVTALGDASKVEVVPLTTQTRFSALAAGEVDVLTNNTTWTLERDTNVNRFNFPAVVFYDGQALMIPRRLGATAATRLDGMRVCVQPGTTTELNVQDFFAQNNLRYTPVVLDGLDEVRRAYDQGECDVFSSDFAALAAQRTLLANPRDHVILPERLSKEPLAPAIRQGDEDFTNVVAWSVFALIEAEEHGITQANVDQIASASTSAAVRRFLGVDGGTAASLGAATPTYARDIVRAVGNYGELFDRHLGPGTPLGLDRGLNNLWLRGGLMYAPPAR